MKYGHDQSSDEERHAGEKERRTAEPGAEGRTAGEPWWTVLEIGRDPGRSEAKTIQKARGNAVEKLCESILAMAGKGELGETKMKAIREVV